MVVVGNFRGRAELRKKPRRQFHYEARIFIAKDEPLLPCTIADISEGGARLVLETGQELPKRFTLLLTRGAGTRRHCKLVWRDETAAGVAFVDP